MMLCFAYVAMLVALLTQMVDPVPVSGFEQHGFSYSIEGLLQLFLSDGGIVLGWTHYLAFDLFAGLWIARDADAKDFARWVQVPILLATFLAGPLGLFIWLIVREKRARKSAAA
ncbi:abscisic acid-deficient protein Aba4 family protein [Alteripontixanthobacter muriae]|uniref:abscisic acid-deficient protein Aba4 family protein n=1 Tax=Alteripontixanthobacter muriae TaxID=2705546 RepID=UPI002FC31390